MNKEEKQKICPICNNKLTFIKQTLDGNVKICEKHFSEAGITMSEILSRSLSPFTLDEIKERIKLLKESNEQAETEAEQFVITKKIGNFVAFDDERQKWAILSPFLGNVLETYNYSDIINFELLEDGNSVASGGLGRALVGGFLFGGVGAIVGGVTGKKKSKEICSSLKLKITINDMTKPVVYINFIETKIKKDSISYRSFSESAQECLSTFQLICDKQKKTTEPQSTVSVADEILKFKHLLDDGIITQDEFDSKKKQLLGL